MMRPIQPRLISALWCVLICQTVAVAAPDGDFTAELAARRARLMERMGGQGMMILFSGEPKTFSNDIDYPFRQENNLYYLTGINQQGITLVLVPENHEQREILFLPKRDPSQETWTGHMLSQEEAKALTGIRTVWHADDFENYVNNVLYGWAYNLSRTKYPDEYRQFFDAIKQGNADVWLLLASEPGQKGRLSREYEFANTLRERFLGVRVKDATPLFSELRRIKSPYELRQLRQAIDITCEAHRAVMQTAKPGLYEYEIDGLVQITYRKHGVQWGFPSIVGSGPNATTLHHWEDNARQMKDRELLLVDIGAETGHYSADVTRTFPVNGKFTKEQRDIYDIVFRAQEEAFKIIRPGVTIQEVHEKARSIVKEGLKAVGLITDTSGNQDRMWFMHGTCHWLGLDVHDPVGLRGLPVQLQPGMTLTVEPGIYLREDALDYLEKTPENQKLIDAIRPAFERYKNIGVRIEDDVLVTETGYELLSRSAPRTVAEIEGLMKR